MNQPRSVKLTGRAARFIQLLQDFGHVDEEAIEQILAAACEAGGGVRGGSVDLPLVRRLAAVTVFSRSGEALDDRRSMLSQDWPLLFS